MICSTYSFSSTLFCNSVALFCIIHLALHYVAFIQFYIILAFVHLVLQYFALCFKAQLNYSANRIINILWTTYLNNIHTITNKHNYTQHLFLQLYNNNYYYYYYYYYYHYTNSNIILLLLVILPVVILYYYYYYYYYQ